MMVESHLRSVPDRQPARTLVVQWGAFRRMCEALAVAHGQGGHPLEVAAFMVGEVLGVDPGVVVATVAGVPREVLAEELLLAAT